MSQDWMQQGPPPPPPPPPPAYNPYGYGGAPPPTMGGSGAPFPWEDRERLGFVNALVETIKLVVTQPVDAFSRLQPNGDLTSPLIFGLLVSWPGFIAAMVWQLVLGSLGSGGGAQFAEFGMLPILVMMVCYPILYAIGVFVSAGLFHLCLMVVKGLEQSSFGFEGTLKVACYGSVGSLAQVVPLLGGFVGGILNLYLIIMGIRTVHRTTTGTAVMAILLPIIVCCVCAVLIGFLGGFGAAMMGQR